MIPPEIWALYVRWRLEFAKAIDETLYPLGWLDQQISCGAVRLAANDKAAVLYEYKQYPSGVWQVEALVAAGDLEVVKAVIEPAIIAEADQLGAIAAQVSSRLGWARALKDNGYTLYQTTLRKLLQPRSE